MNNKGFTLIEFIILVLVMFLVLLFSFSINRKKLSVSLSGLLKTTDDQIFLAAERYASNEEGVFNNNNYACVTTKQLLDKGYLDDESIDNRIIKVKRNKRTRIINDVRYVLVCN